MDKPIWEKLEEIGKSVPPEVWDRPLIGKALIADLKRQLADSVAAHFTCVQMRNEAEAERDRYRALLFAIGCDSGAHSLSEGNRQALIRFGNGLGRNEQSTNKGEP